MKQQNVNSINLPISTEQFIAAVRNMKKEKQESFIEDLLAAVSPEYLGSIRQARKDYREGRVYSHKEVFG